MNRQYAYTYKKEDYLGALSLQKANSRHKAWLIHLAGMAAVGCALYLSLSTLRGTLVENDKGAVLAALIALGIELFYYSPRLRPAILVSLRARRDKTVNGLLGRQEVETGRDEVTLRRGGEELRMRYSNLVRINRNKDTVLFYTQGGTAEAIPARAFGFSFEQEKILEDISQRARDARENPNDWAPLEPYRGQGITAASYTLEAGEYLAMNTKHARYSRAARLKSVKTALVAGCMLLVLAGSVKGLVDLFTGATALTGICAYYIAGVLGCILGALLLLQPAALTNYALRQKLKTGQYPYGYLGGHRLEWNGDWVCFSYGLISRRLPWSAFTRVIEDGDRLYFYQKDVLVFFAPRSGLGDSCFAQLAHRAGAGKAR